MMQPPSPPLPEVNFEHLRLLSIFYYVLGAIYVMVALIPLIHLSVGIAIVTGVLHSPPDTIPLGWMLIGLAAVVVIVGQTYAICMLLTGRYLAAHKAWKFCYVVAAVNCMNVPLGTVLGILSLIQLSKPEVKALFSRNQSASKLMMDG